MASDVIDTEAGLFCTLPRCLPPRTLADRLRMAIANGELRSRPSGQE